MLRKSLALAALVFCSLPIAAAQGPGSVEQTEADRQALQQKWGSFAPKGWRVLMATEGSIFGSKANDAVLVIEKTDPAKMVSNDRLGASQLNTNPRVMLILAGRGDGYMVASRDDGFLPSEGDPESSCLADPLMEGPGIDIKKRIISISLNYWYSCGSWYVNQDTSKFRAEKGRLRLIGQEGWTFHRASGMGSRTSVNFLTGRKKHIDNLADLGPEPEIADGEELPKPITKWSRVDRGPFYLDMMDRKICVDGETAPVWCGR
jgi:hypothetical protein